MFDGDDKPLLIIGVLLAGAIGLVANNATPQFNDPILLDVAQLPTPPMADDLGSAPLQTDLERQSVDLGGGFQASLLFGYSLDGVVVTRRVFQSDATSPVSPLDLGIVWGDLADSPALADIRFRAGRRMVSFRYDGDLPLPDDWDQQVTNNHLIPASDAIRDALLAVEVGQRVRITGFLVNVTSESIHPWLSSTRRNDSSLIGGCEIILVRTVEVIGDSA